MLTLNCHATKKKEDKESVSKLIKTFMNDNLSWTARHCVPYLQYVHLHVLRVYLECTYLRKNW